MGLCKCPKRKVTNLFCYEHRVNVCEYCLVDNHPNCVVQSYLNWLTDSDYDPNCGLCQTSLSNGETIRLNCLHLLHWKCFDDYAASFPETTAPAGYRCPLCTKEVFPPPNEVSPLIEKLREQLKQCNWARAALGLPVLPELNRKSAAPKNVPVVTPSPSPLVPHNSVEPLKGFRATTPATHLDMEDGSASFSVSNSDVTFARKKQFLETSNDKDPLLENFEKDVDNEANKYKRRPVSEWLGGLMRAKYGRSVTQDRISIRKWKIILFLAILIAVFVIYTAFKRDGSVTENDPLLDPMANPNIRAAIEDSKIAHI